MNFTTFSRKPFTVEAVEITEENLDDIAKLIGEVKEKDGVKYIAVEKRIVPNIHRAYVGWWVTRMGDNLRCYSPKIFTDQFEVASAEDAYEFMVQQGSDLPKKTYEIDGFVVGPAGGPTS